MALMFRLQISYLSLMQPMAKLPDKFVHQGWNLHIDFHLLLASKVS
jgi:hypothetical protein